MTAEDLRIEMLERFRERVERDDGDAILDALSLAATLGMVMPTWLASAVTRSIAAYRSYDVKSLDEAFGVQREKNKKIPAAQREGENALYVIAEVLRLHAQGMPISVEIFETAGATCNVSKTTAQDWFYKHKNDRSNIYLVALQMAGVTDK